MKLALSVLLLFVTSITFAQKGEIVKTEDGRTVFLKSDYTWEYIEAVSSSFDKEIKKPTDENACMLEAGFTEPKLDSKIQSILKRGRASMKYVKKKVAKDTNCAIEDVVLLSFTEQKEKAVYNLCANGTKVIYKRMGNTIIKKMDLF
jgi:hypothetical protein